MSIGVYYVFHVLVLCVDSYYLDLDEACDVPCVQYGDL